ncbi:MAG: hypothetical protein ACRC10_03000 [Thermoguttaceae bacterium]
MTNPTLRSCRCLSFPLKGSFLLFFLLTLAFSLGHSPEIVAQTVEVEEDVYVAENANNGSGPMWSFGSTCLGRIGNDVFLTELTLIPETKPLNNCGWKLLKRTEDGWKPVYTDAENRTREPSPIAVFPKQRFVFVSTNPTLEQKKDVYGGLARPAIVRFDTNDFAAIPRTLIPIWEGTPKFNEHSYRSFAADGINQELILFQNIDYKLAEWSFLDRKGNWSAQGQLIWPFGADYSKPQHIRICYPTVAIDNRAVYFSGVSDITEPNPDWAKYKEELTGQKWDYDFRRLFFTWSSDITTGKFENWIEIASREATCGWITPCDLWVGPNQTIYILWYERAINPSLREKFFPDAQQSESLRFAIVQNGNVITRGIIAECQEGEIKPVPSRGRFHQNPDGKLWVVYYVSGAESGKDGEPDRSVSENRICELSWDAKEGKASVGEYKVLQLKQPLSTFYTATPRAGNAVSGFLDMLGHSPNSGNTLRYVRINMQE